MPEGMILKGIGGFYYVDTGEIVVECRARGRFRKNKEKPLPGDRVEIDIGADATGYVTKILPRTSELLRPPVANLDCIVAVSISGANFRSLQAIPAWANRAC